MGYLQEMSKTRGDQQCPIFCLFILFMGLSRQEYRNGLPFPSPVDHVVSELSAMTRPSWVVLHGTAHSLRVTETVMGREAWGAAVHGSQRADVT